MTGAIAEEIRARGNEYGATTGRPRRCGWFDARGAALRRAHQRLDTVALTKLDVLDQCETVKVCTGYRYRGEIITEFPEEETALAQPSPSTRNQMTPQKGGNHRERPDTTRSGRRRWAGPPAG